MVELYLCTTNELKLLLLERPDRRLGRSDSAVIMQDFAIGILAPNFPSTLNSMVRNVATLQTLKFRFKLNGKAL